MSKIDGEFSDSEKLIIDAHCMEMRIDKNDYECTMPLNELLGKLSEDCTPEEKRIIFVELLAVVMADNVYHNSEKTMIRQLKQCLDIRDAEEKEAIKLIAEMKKTYLGFHRLIYGRN